MLPRGAVPHEAGHARGVADDVPGDVVHLGSNQQIAGEHLLLGGDLLARLDLDHVFHGNDRLVDVAFHGHGLAPGLDVLLHLVLVARLGVDHVPLSRHVVRADGFALVLGLLVDQRLGVDDLGVRLGQVGAGLGQRGFGLGQVGVIQADIVVGFGRGPRPGGQQGGGSFGGVDRLGLRRDRVGGGSHLGFVYLKAHRSNNFRMASLKPQSSRPMAPVSSTRTTSTTME